MDLVPSDMHGHSTKHVTDALIEYISINKLHEIIMQMIGTPSAAYALLYVVGKSYSSYNIEKC